MEEKTISCDELKARLDAGDDFALVMVLGDMAFQAKHIPGSLNYSTKEEVTSHLPKDADIVVYCSSSTCFASRVAYRMMIESGYTHVARFVGGLLDWEEHGFPIEGNLA